MAYTEEDSAIVIDGFDGGIAPSPYKGIANIRNLSTAYYPGVAYVNYRRRLATLAATTEWYAGTHSTDVSNNQGWVFTAPVNPPIMTNPVSKAISPIGLIYIQDDSGQIWKQYAVNSTTFNLLEGGAGRVGAGNAGIAYWNNYLVVFGDGLIEFCGDGTGDAGIISSNWNFNGSSGFASNSNVFTTNFGSIPTRISSSFPYSTTAKLQAGDTITFSSTGTLPSPLVAGTTYYIAYNGIINSIPFVAFSVSTSASDANRTFTGAVNSGATSATLSTAWGGTTGAYGVMFSDAEYRSVTLTNGATTATWSGGLSSNVTANFSIVVVLTSDGTGVHTFTDTQNPIPLGNFTNLNVYFVGSAPYSALTFNAGSDLLGSYVDPSGNTVTGVWKGASGLYNIVMANGQKVPATFTNGSPTINLLSPLTYVGWGANWQVQFLDTTITNYRPYTSKVDGSLYFCNGQFLGRLATTSDPNITFYPNLGMSYSVSFGVASIPEEFTDTITDMVDLKTQLVIAGQRDIYTWDYVSAQTTAPSPVGEQIKGITNLLNNIYILAGQKGNIYVSNGYSAQLLYKLPDFIAGVIDPVWSWGDIMTHRSRLFFQALAQNTSGTNLLAGIFSLTVSPSMLGETASGLVMEAQNSYGLTPSSGATGAGLLIDNSPSSSGYDSYYSVWSNGASLGGIDYNDTSLWQNYEPTIETDIIPIGTILDKKTFGFIEFKLDRPMATGDFIKLYWRPSLSDSYTLIGTTSTTQLSEYFPSNIYQSQWAQFKVTFKCASSGSSFIPLREIRLTFN